MRKAFILDLAMTCTVKESGLRDRLFLSPCNGAC